MAGVRIVIDSNAAEVEARLGQLGDRLAPAGLEEVYREFGAYLERSLDDRFAQQVDPDGHPWAPLSETTKARKPKNKDKILQLEGHLRDSFHYQATMDGVLFGTNDIRAATHQFGAKTGEFGRYYQLARMSYDKGDFRRYAGMHTGHPIPWGDIPARRMLGLSTDDVDALLQIAEDHIAAGE